MSTNAAAQAASEVPSTPRPLDPPPMGDLAPNHPLRTVGNTPLFELPRYAAEVAPIRIFGKAEWANPGGSVKDRPALNMILHGIADGQLSKDKTLLDATSGNTGIAYAMIGAALGYRVKLCIPASTGKLHQRILRAYGAVLEYTPATEGSDGAQRRAIQMAKDSPDEYFYPDQYNNDANWSAHYHGTGREIWEQTEGTVTHFVAGLGTTGTFTGAVRRLRRENPSLRAVSFQPDSPMHGLEGLKHMPTSLKPGFYDEQMADENLWVPTEEAQEAIHQVARLEGLLLGTSAGAGVAASLQLARRLKQEGRTDAVIVTILCDAASKYLDHEFWK